MTKTIPRQSFTVQNLYLKKDDPRLPAQNKRIKEEVKRINQQESLIDELGSFRLASAHESLGLVHISNAVLVDIKIKFITKSGVEITQIIPVKIEVTKQDGTKKQLDFFSGKNFTEDDFIKFYKKIDPTVKQITKQDHYHSEAFLVYFLTSGGRGKEFLRNEFFKKGLLTKDETNQYVSNIQGLVKISFDLHSSKVVCYKCTPFLRKAQPFLLDSIYNVLLLTNIPQNQRVQNIEFNISANKNFDYYSLASTIAPHIPVEEDQNISILRKTESLLGANKTFLQKTGELSNRTYFLAGSSELSDVQKAKVQEDKKLSHIFTASQVKKIQKVYRRHLDLQLEMAQEELDLNKSELETLNKELLTLEARKELLSDVQALKDSVEAVKIKDQDLSKEIRDLYNVAINECKLEEKDNSSFDDQSKMKFLFDLNNKSFKDSVEEDIKAKQSEISNLLVVVDELEEKHAKLYHVVASRPSNKAKVVSVNQLSEDLSNALSFK